MANRECMYCGKPYEYELCANLVLFCPHCYQYDYSECEYGYGPVVPCFIYLGNEVIAMVNYCEKDDSLYHLTSQKYNLDEVLKHRYLEALHEAKDIIAEILMVKKRDETICGEKF